MRKYLILPNDENASTRDHSLTEQTHSSLKKTGHTLLCTGKIVKVLKEKKIRDDQKFF